MSIQNLSPAARFEYAMAATPLAGRGAECAQLDRLLADVRAGQSAVLVLRGDRGIGKTALLDHAARRAEGFRILRARGVAAEMDLPYAGLHLFCAPLLDGLDRLQPGQREALATAVGLNAGPQPDRFLVGLAILGLLSAAAEEQPLLCIVDDADWLDRSSAQVLAFVARRLGTESVGLLLAEREPQGVGDLDGLPELVLGPLSRSDARALFDTVMSGRVDESVAERIIAETRGNPLALLELLPALSPAALAGGYGVTGTCQPRGRTEEHFLERVQALPPDSRVLLLAAAAEPIGDPSLHWRVAAQLGIPTDASQRLESDGLLLIGPRIMFRRPLLRSAIYAVSSKRERRTVHRALAAATDPVADADRRIWHLAQAMEWPDEEVAHELERQAPRACERGGLAAGAAFLEQAALLTIDPDLRAERALVAAAAKHEAGAPDAAVRLLVAAELGPLDESRRARLERQRAQIAFASSRGDDAPELLLRAARRLQPLDLDLARDTYLEALAAGIHAGRLRRGDSTSDCAPVRTANPRPVDLLLDALLVRRTEGFPAAVEPLRLALKAFRDSASGDESYRWLWLVSAIAADLWDADGWQALTALGVRLARERGALAAMPHALTSRAIVEVYRGDFAGAAVLVDEAEAIAAALGSPSFTEASLLLAAWRGDKERALELFEDASQDARNRGEGATLTVVSLAAAVLYNGLGRYDEALRAGLDATEFDDPDLLGWSLVEVVEAGVRSGRLDQAEIALQRLAERTSLCSTDLALGIEAFARSLLGDGQAAEDLHLEAIERLERSGLRAYLGRAQLVYGEWLRRQGRRIDARVQLRTAGDLFATSGAEAFAERARRELLATGEKARSRAAETDRQLTPQETQIAFLARDGHTNPEIGSRLSISPRTVEYHLHKVFTKFGISSRTELHLVLAGP